LTPRQISAQPTIAQKVLAAFSADAAGRSDIELGYLLRTKLLANCKLSDDYKKLAYQCHV
jgi:hypothetical protein